MSESDKPMAMVRVLAKGVELDLRRAKLLADAGYILRDREADRDGFIGYRATVKVLAALKREQHALRTNKDERTR